MNLLALDTSTDACTVAVQTNKNKYHRTIIESKTHAQNILPLIKEILSEAKITLEELNAIAFGRGPGSFTGLRIASSVTQALAFVNQIPVIPISSLLMMAQTAYRIHQIPSIAICLDARMEEVYFAKFILGENQLMTRIDQEKLISIPELQTQLLSLPSEILCLEMDGNWQQMSLA